MKKHDSRTHAPLPPSASGRWLNCAPSQGYIRKLIAQKTIQKRVSGPAAQRGTRIHEIAEKMLAAMIAGTNPPPVGKGDAEEHAEAKAYALFCHEKLEQARLVYRSVSWGIEDRSELTEDCWGSSDFWILADRRLIVTDLKTGREGVVARGNSQLIIYGLGLIRKKELDVDELEVVIWQPNANDGFSPERGHTYSRREVVALAAKIDEGIAAAAAYLVDRDDHEANLKAGDWCGWCDALAVCKAARAHALATVTRDFKPVQVDRMEPPDPTTLEPDQVGQILSRAAMFSKWLDAVEVRALELMHRGRPVPGFKVVEKTTRRAWLPKLTPSQIARKVGLSTKDVVESKTLSPSQVEKRLDPTTRKKVATMTFKPVGAPTVVPESDRREALPNAKIAFTPVSNEEDDDD